ncbi:hypothetical protein NBRC111894_366 [Sporolactobacillus inulinus]|uniref:Uncharacterized protein n=1 Tax=Sporolactobacillus inulinus TaxID=2078 RepID=A0A4Y1Z6Z3_9BACL|nr:hypothetical protein NBRC111894_366 [Sporolactobacillus inulinus]
MIIAIRFTGRYITQQFMHCGFPFFSLVSILILINIPE